MKKWIVLVSLVAAAGCATGQKAGSMAAPAAKPAVKTSVAAPSPQVQAITTYKFGDSREPLTVVEDLVRDSLASPEKSSALAAQLAGLLATNATPDCKQFACRQLAIIGTADTVPALAPLLLKDDTADMARYALQPIPGAEADAALLEALPKVSKSVKIGIIDTLGARKAKCAVNTLKPLAKDNDSQIAEAAKSALARIKK
ncbi:MAG: hypothetical protein HZB26_23290 [Candidatus Hydrogenedentes bacterium]|nr:hypothetical protein [Candidatus Hydrogenedentota bacterium]